MATFKDYQAHIERFLSPLSNLEIQALQEALAKEPDEDGTIEVPMSLISGFGLVALYDNQMPWDLEAKETEPFRWVVNVDPNIPGKDTIPARLHPIVRENREWTAAIISIALSQAVKSA